MRSALPFPIYIGSPVRTPIGKFGGSLKGIKAPELAGLALKECVQRNESEKADWVLLGHARQAGAGPNPARQAVFKAGLDENTPAITLNQACASGLTAIINAAEKISLGRANSVYAGGVESMSNTPYLLTQARWGQRLGHGEVTDGMYQDGFFCPMSQMVMGETVERFLAQELKISRKEQDEYALESQKRAARAWEQGAFKAETFSIEIGGKEKKTLAIDEHFRSDTTLESLAKLAPVFDPKTGTVSAGNSSGITDGAAFVHISKDKRPTSVAEILDYEIVALDPRRMGLGPVPATKNLLKRQGLTVKDIEAFEINEAFAAQVLACNRELGIPHEKLNAWGGSIAIGHPIGATGCRITVTLLSRLKNKSGALGLATLCVSGGHGVALLVKML